MKRKKQFFQRWQLLTYTGILFLTLMLSLIPSLRLLASDHVSGGAGKTMVAPEDLPPPEPNVPKLPEEPVEKEETVSPKPVRPKEKEEVGKPKTEATEERQEAVHRPIITHDSGLGAREKPMTSVSGWKTLPQTGQGENGSLVSIGFGMLSGIVLTFAGILMAKEKKSQNFVDFEEKDE